MPNPGSHHYDIKRTRLRGEYDDHGVPDQHADRAANEELQEKYPAQPLGDPQRAAGPRGVGGTSQGDPDIDDPSSPPAGQIELRSSAFTDHTVIPERCSYERGNVSPPLEWAGIPDGTQELALLCEDPDAPGDTFTHWVVTGLPPGVAAVEEGALPENAIPGRNGFGELGWGGPRPPVGDEPHRHFFRLYAVDKQLGNAEGVTSEQVHAALDGHTLARGTLVGLFGR
jgi:Raf kinase inhibitor-like YbhB/YbcL family protein